MGRGTRKRKMSRVSNLRRELRDGLRGRLARGPRQDVAIVVQPTGVEKMSDVLEDFVEPYADKEGTIEGYGKLLQLAVVAWNAALAPEPRRTTLIDDMVARLFLELTDAIAADDLKHVLRQLIARKEARFSENRRVIIAFELKDLGDRWHLSVTSLLGC